jgi:uncharacterized protein YodC (DUF2158 family)
MPAMDPLWPGTLVRLVSGGPLMTVLQDETLGGDRAVVCSWCNAAGEYHEVSLPRGAVASAPGDAVAAQIAQQIWGEALQGRAWRDRTLAALDVAARAGRHPDARVKAWVIDQMVQWLTGADYPATVAGWPGWDQGVEPPDVADRSGD